MPDGTYKKFTLEGPGAVKITDITPLWYTISYDRRAGDSFRLTVAPEWEGRSADIRD